MDASVVAVDLGGTRMRAALVDPSGTIGYRCVRPTPRDATCPDALLSLMGEIRRTTGAPPSAAVIGVPGRVDHRDGRLEFAPNLPPTWGPSLAEAYLSGVLGLPVSLANDADLATAGEYVFGAGRGGGVRDLLYVTVSTGIGAGVILDGCLAHGRRSIAEAGHTILDRMAASRDEPATLEQLGSGTALARLAAERGLTDLPGAELLGRAASGDPVAAEVWRSAAEAVGMGVASLAHLFAPELVVVGGGVGNTGILLGPIRGALERFGPRGLPQPIAVTVATLGDDAGLMGAAAWPSVFRRRPDHEGAEAS